VDQLMEWLSAMAAQLPEAEGRSSAEREAQQQAQNAAVLMV
jgi:transcription-repair coupling factor (superfamily II helicase)